MQCSVTIVVELAPEADISQMETAIQEAGQHAMREALKHAVRGYEEAHAACPHCVRRRREPEPGHGVAAGVDALWPRGCAAAASTL